MGTPYHYPEHVFIELRDGKIVHNATSPDFEHKITQPKVVLYQKSIRVGCTTISMEAAQFLLKEHERIFGPDQLVPPCIYVVQFKDGKPD